MKKKPFITPSDIKYGMRLTKKLKKKLGSYFYLLIALLAILATTWVLYNKSPKVRQVLCPVVSMVTNETCVKSEIKEPDIVNDKEVFGEIKVGSDTLVPTNIEGNFDYTSFPETSEPFVVINNNVPSFIDKDLTNTKPYETYSRLDSLGRVGVANALIDKSLMPNDKRGAIDSVRPSGWKNKKYDKNLVDGGWIFNRAHLIGFQLTGENANEGNLMTGTRSFNVDGMLPFENQVAEYVKNGGKVRYRITPVFKGEELVARGIYLEAKSIDSNDISIFVWIPNIQKGIDIDYSNGDTRLSE